MTHHDKARILTLAGFTQHSHTGNWSKSSATPNHEWQISARDMDTAILVDSIGRDVDRMPFPYAAWDRKMMREG